MAKVASLLCDRVLVSAALILRVGASRARRAVHVPSIHDAACWGKLERAEARPPGCTARAMERLVCKRKASARCTHQCALACANYQAASADALLPCWLSISRTDGVPDFGSAAVYATSISTALRGCAAMHGAQACSSPATVRMRNRDSLHAFAAAGRMRHVNVVVIDVAAHERHTRASRNA